MCIIQDTQIKLIAIIIVIKYPIHACTRTYTCIDGKVCNNLIILDKKDHIETEGSYVNDYTHKFNFLFWNTSINHNPS